MSYNSTHSKLRKLVEEVVVEYMSDPISQQDASIAESVVNTLSMAIDTVRTSTKDTKLVKFLKQIMGIRTEIMRYVESGGQYSWEGRSPSGFKLIKKG